MDDMQDILNEIEYREDYVPLLRQDPDGQRLFVQVRFLRQDIVTGKWDFGYSGKRYVSAHMAKSEFVALVFGTFLALEEHECRESFKYRGRRIFGPHIDVDALWEVARKIDVREPVNG
jgi:hypothetical protein